MRIAVLLGGTSAERDVSLVTGIAVARALIALGHQVRAIDCAYGDREIDPQATDVEHIIGQTPSEIERQRRQLDRNILSTVQFLLAEPVDLVFIALHGGYGENGQLQALLELLQIPFVGSGSLASALGMNKHLSKVIFKSQAVPTAPWLLVRKGHLPRAEQLENLGFPVVVKPNEQGSTVGLSVVYRQDEVPEALNRAFQYGPKVLVEKYIPGKEITAAILDGGSLPLIEIVPQSGLYDYQAKYQKGKTEYRVPAPLDAQITEQIQRAAERAFAALGCADYARVDFRLQDDGQFYCLEVNTLPGMTPTSLVPKAAAVLGLSFNQLIEKIVQTALKRYNPSA
ncbi:MAG: D-alanine--D-alanine ligase [Calditrichaeota bacterium]|nr:MAG: D-alanine--D-alanine ligase [Calditrichota bacterium]